MKPEHPVYLLEPTTGETTLVSAADMPEAGVERLAKIEGLAQLAAGALRVANAASIVLGLLILRLQAERLYTLAPPVDDGAGKQRPMTAAEYLELFRVRLDVSASTISRARTAANLYLLLYQHNVAPPLARAHLTPLRDADTAHVVQIYTAAVRKHGDALTEDLVEEEVAAFYGRMAKKRESSYDVLKRKIAELGLDILRCLQADDHASAEQKLQQLLEFVGANALAKRSGKSTGARSVDKSKGTGPAKFASTESPRPMDTPLQTGGQLPAEMTGEAVVASSASSDAAIAVPTEDESEKRKVATTTVWRDGCVVKAKHETFAGDNRPAAYFLLKEKGFRIDYASKTWCKKMDTRAEAEALCNSVVAAIDEATQSKSKS